MPTIRDTTSHFKVIRIKNILLNIFRNATLRQTLIISTGYEPEYSRIVEQLVIDSIEQGSQPVVLDLAPIMLSPSHSYSPRVLKLGRITSLDKVFKTQLESLGAQVINATSICNAEQSLSPTARVALEDSTQSALLTFFRTDILNMKNRRIHKVRDWLLSDGARSYAFVSNFLPKNDFSNAYLPNGRFPVQRLAKVALTEANVPVFHFEKGATRDHAFLRPYSPHDRIAGQVDIESIAKKTTPENILMIANDWLEARQPSSATTNEYTSIWAPSSAASFIGDAGVKRIGFFTSSQDEFLHLGPDWQIHTWGSQFEAFSTLMREFESRGYSCFLRVHPNLATKEHACFKREFAGLKKLQAAHPNLEIFWHDDNANSYDLLDTCTGVVVWDSTIGLEASARGIPVWNCAASYYGMVADTRQILGPEDVNTEVLTPWIVDNMKAKEFIAGMVLRDHQLRTAAQKWASWDLQQPPLMVKLSALVNNGGAPTLKDSMLSILDPWRHRRHRVNWRLLKRKVLK